MDDSKRAAALLMSQCMSTFAQELNIRAKMIFGPGGNGEGGSANPADLANDRAAFSSAGMKGAGVGIVSTVSSVVVSKRWICLRDCHSLASWGSRGSVSEISSSRRRWVYSGSCPLFGVVVFAKLS